MNERVYLRGHPETKGTLVKYGGGLWTVRFDDGLLCGQRDEDLIRIEESMTFKEGDRVRTINTRPPRTGTVDHFEEPYWRVTMDDSRALEGWYEKSLEPLPDLPGTPYHAGQRIRTLNNDQRGSVMYCDESTITVRFDDGLRSSAAFANLIEESAPRIGDRVTCDYDRSSPLPVGTVTGYEYNQTTKKQRLVVNWNGRFTQTYAQGVIHPAPKIYAKNDRVIIGYYKDLFGTVIAVEDDRFLVKDDNFHTARYYDASELRPLDEQFEVGDRVTRDGINSNVGEIIQIISGYVKLYVVRWPNGHVGSYAKHQITKERVNPPAHIYRAGDRVVSTHFPDRFATVVERYPPDLTCLKIRYHDDGFFAYYPDRVLVPIHPVNVGDRVRRLRIGSEDKYGYVVKVAGNTMLVKIDGPLEPTMYINRDMLIATTKEAQAMNATTDTNTMTIDPAKVSERIDTAIDALVKRVEMLRIKEIKFARLLRLLDGDFESLDIDTGTIEVQRHQNAREMNELAAQIERMR